MSGERHPATPILYDGARSRRLRNPVGVSAVLVGSERKLRTHDNGAGGGNESFGGMGSKSIYNANLWRHRRPPSGCLFEFFVAIAEKTAGASPTVFSTTGNRLFAAKAMVSEAIKIIST
jgi:hypothetical protein